MNASVHRLRRAPTYGLALAALCCATEPARAEFYTQVWESRFEQAKSLRLNPEVGFYSTEANFNAQGNREQPTDLEKYSRVQTAVNATHGVNRFLSAYARLTWLRVQTDLAGGVSGNAFGFGDQTVGATVRFWHNKELTSRLKGWSLDLQAQVDWPTYSNTRSEAAGTPYLGDGSVDITGGLFLNAPFFEDRGSHWLLTAGAGYTWRSADFSAAIPGSITFRYQPAKEGFVYGLGIAGVQSLFTDPYAKNPGLTPRGSPGAGGSFMVNAINPSIFQVRGHVGYQLAENLKFTLSGSQALIGKGSPIGFLVSLGLHARIGPGPSKDPGALSPPDYGRSNQGFVNYSFEGRVIRVNDRLNQVKIDKGSQDGVEVGQVFDIFVIKPDGGNGGAVARAKCVNTQLNESTLAVTEFFKEVWIEEGFVVKRPLQ